MILFAKAVIMGAERPWRYLYGARLNPYLFLYQGVPVKLQDVKSPCLIQ